MRASGGVGGLRAPCQPVRRLRLQRTLLRRRCVPVRARAGRTRHRQLQLELHERLPRRRHEHPRLLADAPQRHGVSRPRRHPRDALRRRARPQDVRECVRESDGDGHAGLLRRDARGQRREGGGDGGAARGDLPLHVPARRRARARRSAVGHREQPEGAPHARGRGVVRGRGQHPRDGTQPQPPVGGPRVLLRGGVQPGGDGRHGAAEAGPRREGRAARL